MNKIGFKIPQPRSGKSFLKQFSELEKKIKDYNNFYSLADSHSKHEITSREVRKSKSVHNSPIYYECHYQIAEVFALS